jgi:hypothetical protein
MQTHFEKILKSCNFATSFETQLKVNAYGALKSFAGKYPYSFRVLSPVIGVLAGFTTVAKQIIQIVEDVFLGLTEFFGSLANVKGCSLKLGLSRVVILTTLDALKLPFSAIYGALEAVEATFRILMDPKQAFEDLEDLPRKRLMTDLDKNSYDQHKKLYPEFFTLPEFKNSYK